MIDLARTFARNEPSLASRRQVAAVELLAEEPLGLLKLIHQLQQFGQVKDVAQRLWMRVAQHGPALKQLRLRRHGDV